MKVVYFLSEYPALNITFIINEIYFLEKNGVEVAICYEDRGLMKEVQPNYRHIRAQTIQIYPLGNLKRRALSILKAQAVIFCKHPARYVDSIRLLLRLFNYSNIRSFILSTLFVSKLNQLQADVLYIHDAVSVSYVGLFCAKLTNIPSGIAFHTYGLFCANRYVKEKLEHTNFSIFQSNYSKHFAIQRAHVGIKKLNDMYVVSSAGVDTNFFKPHINKVLLLKKRRILKIICVARLEKMKGLDRLIKAVRMLVDNGLDAKCVIIGYGSEQERLKNLTQTLHLNSYVSFVGPIGHTTKLRMMLEGSDLFILPSVIDAEGDRDMQPNAIKEAMAMKCIVITSRLGGIREVIQDGKNGFLLSSSSSKNIVDCIIKVQELSPLQKESIRDAARQTIVKYFEAQKVSNELYAVLQKYAAKSD